MDYSQLSDQEINMQVAKIIHPGREVIESKSRPPSACLIGCLPSKWLDYCNNPADAYPVIYKNGISIGIYGYGEWGAGTINHTHIDGVNPLRAAMIVFLRMQDAKHD